MLYIYWSTSVPEMISIRKIWQDYCKNKTVQFLSHSIIIYMLSRNDGEWQSSPSYCETQVIRVDDFEFAETVKNASVLVWRPQLSTKLGRVSTDVWIVITGWTRIVINSSFEYSLSVQKKKKSNTKPIAIARTFLSSRRLYSLTGASPLPPPPGRGGGRIQSML